MGGIAPTHIALSSGDKMDVGITTTGALMMEYAQPNGRGWTIEKDGTISSSFVRDGQGTTAPAEMPKNPKALYGIALDALDKFKDHFAHSQIPNYKAEEVQTLQTAIKGKIGSPTAKLAVSAP